MRRLSGFSTNNSNQSISNTKLDNIKVAVRIRPLTTKELANGVQSCCRVNHSKVITIQKDADSVNYLKSQMAQTHDYTFDEAFDENANQYSIYERTTKDYIPAVLSGYNVTVFAYGATGSGKTHTMLGNTRSHINNNNSNVSDAGIIPNAVKDLFTLISMNESSTGLKYQVIVSYYEVYNEQVYDLLETTSKPLSIREDTDKGLIVIAGITEQVVTNYESVISILLSGNKNRKTEATMANQVSSRSHAIFQLTIKQLKNNSNHYNIISKLSLIDLAGSERASVTNNRGIRLVEGANINKSLLALANCINTLSDNTLTNRKTNVKYRDSKLTHILKNSLDNNNCYLIMIATINPSITTYEDSHNTLKYANRTKNIKSSVNLSNNLIANQSIISDSKLHDVIRYLTSKLSNYYNINDLPNEYLQIVNQICSNNNSYSFLSNDSIHSLMASPNLSPIHKHIYTTSSPLNNSPINTQINNVIEIPNQSTNNSPTRSPNRLKSSNSFNRMSNLSNISSKSINYSPSKQIKIYNDKENSGRFPVNSPINSLVVSPVKSPISSPVSSPSRTRSRSPLKPIDNQISNVLDDHNLIKASHIQNISKQSISPNNNISLINESKELDIIHHSVTSNNHEPGPTGSKRRRESIVKVNNLLDQIVIPNIQVTNHPKRKRGFLSNLFSCKTVDDDTIDLNNQPTNHSTINIIKSKRKSLNVRRLSTESSKSVSKKSSTKLTTKVNNYVEKEIDCLDIDSYYNPI